MEKKKDLSFNYVQLHAENSAPIFQLGRLYINVQNNVFRQQNKNKKKKRQYCVIVFVV